MKELGEGRVPQIIERSQKPRANMVGGERPNISVFGLGHVGLVTAATLANCDYSVVGIDADEQIVQRILRREIPFFEPGLAQYTKSALDNGKLRVTTDATENKQADIAYITVGTPTMNDGSISLTHIEGVAKAIGKTLRDRYQLVVVKSTVTPGTARKLIRPLIAKTSGRGLGRDFGVCSNPEFLREGRAIEDSLHPDRIIIGGDDEKALDMAEGFYKRLYSDKVPVIVRTTHENAELIKYANNAFLASKVSLINAIAEIAEATAGADIKVVAKGIGLDKRIGPSFLDAGFGWGGSCLPKDLRALKAYAMSVGASTDFLEGIMRTNDTRKKAAITLSERILGTLTGKRVAILGLAFKPGTDDIREAVSIPIIRDFLDRRAKVVVYDPVAMQNARMILGDEVIYANNPIECISQADCCILVTEWNEFADISASSFVLNMRQPVLVDGRRIYDANAMRAAGVRYVGVGLGGSE